MIIGAAWSLHCCEPVALTTVKLKNTRDVGSLSRRSWKGPTRQNEWTHPSRRSHPRTRSGETHECHFHTAHSVPFRIKAHGWIGHCELFSLRRERGFIGRWTWRKWINRETPLPGAMAPTGARKCCFWFWTWASGAVSPRVQWGRDNWFLLLLLKKTNWLFDSVAAEYLDKERAKVSLWTVNLTQLLQRPGGNGVSMWSATRMHSLSIVHLYTGTR